MRITGLILSFYIILLAAVPCCAFDDCPEDKTEQTTSQKDADDDSGNCSPFFSCEGCSSATIAWHPAQFELIHIQNKPAYTSHLQYSLPKVKYDFWQPPKLG